MAAQKVRGESRSDILLPGAPLDFRLTRAEAALGLGFVRQRLKGASAGGPVPGGEPFPQAKPCLAKQVAIRVGGGRIIMPAVE